MIDESKFPANIFRQQGNECIPASLGTALYPFTNIEVQKVVDATIRCWPSARGNSGYDRVDDILKHTGEALFTGIRSRVRLERQHGLNGLDVLLCDECATAIVALSFSNRLPHSVCISHNGTLFVLRDSARSADTETQIGVSVLKVLALVPTNGVAGDVIVFHALKQEEHQ